VDTKYVVVLSAVCVAVGLHADRALAGALDNSAVGIKGIAMGSALTGIADDASAVYFNPAGLAFLASGDTLFEAYGYFSFTSFAYENAGAAFESHERFFLPGLFAAHSFDRFALGFGSYVPYGGGGTAYQDFMSTGVELKGAAGLPAFTAAAAYEVTPDLSVGAGVSMYVGVVDTRAPLMISQPAPALVDYESHYSGISGYGWNLGVLYKPTDVLSVGVSIISPTSLRMKGEEQVRIPAFGVDTTTESEIELGVPWYFAAGLGYRLRPGLTLGLTACWMKWGDQKEVVIAHDSTGESTRVPTHYKDGYRLSVGMEHLASTKLTLRAGVKYVSGATEEEGLAPSSNDVDIVVPSVGVGYRFGRALELDLTAFYVSGRRTTRGQEAFDQDHVSVLVGLRWGS